MKASRLWIGFVALVLAGCSPTTNLLNPSSPRFLGSFAPAAPISGLPPSSGSSPLISSSAADRCGHRGIGDRWPIERSWKVILRVLAAVHLETQVLISDHAREDQVAAIFRDAAGFTGPVVIAGDFNSQGIGPFWCVTAIAG